MKNILYIGHYKDNNGLGEASRRYINWISSNHDKFNLSIRPLYLTTSNITEYINNEQYVEYENNSSKKYDFLLQHTLPEYIEYNQNFGKNIAIIEIETINIQYNGWADKLNMMDEIWVNSNFALESLVLSGVYKPIIVVPEPYDYNNSNRDFFTYSDDARPFIFYTIGQYAEKRNIKSIILAYLSEFNKDDNVKLFIKTCDHRQKNEDLENVIKYDISIIKNIVRKTETDYGDVDVLCGYLPSKDIARLHKSGNCYVNFSRADGFGSCAIEAAIAGRIVITPKNIGSSTYLNPTNVLMINSNPVPVICSNSQVKNMYTTNEIWYEPSVNELKLKMREALNLSEKQRIELNKNFNQNIFCASNLNEFLK